MVDDHTQTDPIPRAGTPPTADDPVGARSPDVTAPGSTEPAPDLSQATTDFGLSRDDTGAEADPLLGRELGGMHIRRLLGQGGMGRVYEALQHNPTRSVAVKVMRPGAGSPAAVQRFRREAEILGRLRHPGIAHVYAAGVHDDSGHALPFIVMEFVPDAEPLGRSCARRGLGFRQRLELLRDICDAIGHGHAQGVVHRDLKPGNILVDGAGRPKVIDFGIARQTDPPSDGGGDARERVTETGQFVGTRQYTSPEQFRGGAIDARTDVYALGVILHELLAGRLPYEIDSSSLVDTARVVCEEPPKPLVIADRELAHGVKAIAARCLAKQPADRYADAGQLAADLGRLLAGERVHARAPGFTEAAAFWLRRHRTPAAAAATAGVTAIVVTLAVVAGLRDTQSTSPRIAPGRRPDAAADSADLTAKFEVVSSGRTTPLDQVSLQFSKPVQSLSTADLRLTRDGVAIPTDGLTLQMTYLTCRIGDLKRVTSEEGTYVLELVGTDHSPVDEAGNRLAAPASVTWEMPPYREITFSLLDDSWRDHVVSMNGVEAYTERSAGEARFIRPTVSGREGSIVMRFDAPFTIHDATLVAGIQVWTTGDPFPYDPGSRAAIDVSPDGETWTTVASVEAGRGGGQGGPFDIGTIVAGGTAIWVRARLTGTREWPGDGLIFSQFLRSYAGQEFDPFVLTITGPHPPVIPGVDSR